MAKSVNINQSVLKVLSVFTSVQVFNMLCNVVKMKFVSIWLEASGMGLFGIFQQVTDTTATLTDFGLRQSTTREVALTRHESGRLGRLLATIRTWNILAGLTGMVILTLLSPLLSLLFFEDKSFWWAFALLGVCILFNAMTAGENSILQGLSRFKHLARAGLLASLTGLAISIPMFRFLGKNSVILSILVYSAAAYYFIRKSRPKDIESARPSPMLLREGKGFAKLGGLMALAAFISSLTLTIFVTWLNRYASIAEVGYYQAGNTMVVRYMGFVLTAIGLEFYPRITTCAGSSHRQSVFVTHEMAFTLNILTPLVLLFIILRPWLIQLLYTSRFEVILPFITLGILHTVFRTPSVVMAYTIISRGNGLLYLIMESVDSAIGLCLCIGGYMMYGLAGVGGAYIIWFAFYLGLTWAIATLKYKVRVGKGAVYSLLVAVVVTAGSALLAVYTPVYIYAPVILIMIVPYFWRIKRLWNRNRK